MEEYPEELRTPPVGLVALVGCNEYHEVISNHLQAEQPPINTLALPDVASLSKLLIPSSKKPNGDSGIVKRDWLIKHRTRVPSLVAALFHSDNLSGDLTDGLSLLENVRNCISPKNIKLAVVVILSNSHSQYDSVLNDERISTLRKRAELDAKCVLIFNPNDSSFLKQSLSRLSSSFSELSLAYYRDEGRRIRARVEKKSFNSSDLNVRYCFKVAVYAEFRRDWAEALRFYEDAYQILREMVGTSTGLPAIQRLIQIKTVAEQLNFKILTLLLHRGKLNEALTCYNKHVASYKKLVGVSQAAFLHWEWMSRQFLVIAELLETTSKLNPASSAMILQSSDRAFFEWEFQPAYYYHMAAMYLKEKKKSLKGAISISESTDQVDSLVDSVVPSIFVGEYSRLLEHEDKVDMHSLTDEEFIHYSIHEGKRFQDAFEIIALLKRCYESFNNLKAQRMASFCGFNLAVEYYFLNDFDSARKFFDNVATIYRKEGWVDLLLAVLVYLRECSRKSGLVRDFIEYSLEMAALPVGSDYIAQPDISESKVNAGSVLEQNALILNKILGFVDTDAERTEDLFQVSQDALHGTDHLHLEIDLVSPLRSVLLASVAFHDQVIKPGVPAVITVSLLSQLPLTMTIDQLEVKFNQSESNFTIVNSQTVPAHDGHYGTQRTCRLENFSTLTLVTNKWLRLTYDVFPDHSGKLECLYIVAKIGSRLIISCRAESPASMDDLPLWKFENRVETSPVQDAGLSLLGQKFAQVEEPDPKVDLVLGTSGSALVGETFLVPVLVVAREHNILSGELKINLVDITGGQSLSPRELEPSSSDSLHVELVGLIAPDEEESGTEVVKDDRKTIRQTFGLVSVPKLTVGESWSCSLQIRWRRPKSIMLYVSLGYFTHFGELSSQKVHVHKSLQLEGRPALQVSNEFIPPFRQESLFLSKLRSSPNSNEQMSLPVKASSTLVISAKNASEVPLQLLSMSIELDKEAEKAIQLQDVAMDATELTHIAPGEEFKRVFTVTPMEELQNMSLGSAIVSWRRSRCSSVQSSVTDSWVLARNTLPCVNVELPPLVVVIEPPHSVAVGVAFTFKVKIKNQTRLPEEIKFSLADAQSFVVSGSHNDTVLVLPNSEHRIGFKMVPLTAGSQQLPRVTVTSVRHSACFQPPCSAANVFVYPCEALLRSSFLKENEV